MSNVTLLTEPNFLSPLNEKVWFNATGDWSTVPGFEYLYKVRQIATDSSSVLDNMGSYKIPPGPDGSAYFSPNKILRTKFNYGSMPLYGLQGYTTDTNWVKYNVQYGFDSELELPYYDEIFGAGSFVSLTFSYPHNLSVGNYIVIHPVSTANPQYATTASVTAVVNTFEVKTDVPWGVPGPTIGGTITIPYYDAFQYISSSGTLGITFSGTHMFKVGDVITIDKTNKYVDIEYDGTASVILSTTSSIALDKEFLGTQSILGINGGIISNLQRVIGTSSQLYGYNGTRQYDERTRNFGLSYSVGAATITTNGLTAAGFLTHYEGWKDIPSSAEEMSSIFVQAGSGLIKIEMKTYDVNLTQISTYQATFSSVYSQAYVIGVGTDNVIGMFGGSSLNGVTYYEVYLTDTSAS